MGLIRKKVSGRSHDVLVDEDTGRFVKWVPPERENPSSGVKTFRAHNPTPDEMVTLENPAHSSTQAAPNPMKKNMDEATKQFTNVLRTAGAVTGGTVIAKQVVGRASDRIASQVGLSGTTRRLARIGVLAAASTFAMMSKKEIVKSIGVGHGVVVVEEGIDLVMGFVGGSNGSNGNGEVSGARALLGPGLASGYSSEPTFRPRPAVEPTPSTGRDWAPGS